MPPPTTTPSLVTTKPHTGHYKVLHHAGSHPPTTSQPSTDIEEQRSRLHDKLQQLHGYIRRLGQLTATTTPSNTEPLPIVLIKTPGQHDEVSSSDELYEAFGEESKVDTPAAALAGDDIAVIEQWLQQLKQQRPSQASKHSSALSDLSHIASLIRGKQHGAAANNFSKTVVQQHSTSARKPTQPSAGNQKHTAAIKINNAQRFATLQPKKVHNHRLQLVTTDNNSTLQSSVPLNNYSPANTAFVGGRWVRQSVESNSVSAVDHADDESVSDLDSIEDFDAGGKIPLTATNGSNNNGHAGNDHTRSMSSLISPISHQSAASSSNHLQSPQVAAHKRIEDDFGDIDDSSINEDKASQPLMNGGRGNFTIPKDAAYVDGRWINTAATTDQEDIDALSDIDTEDDRRHHHRTQHSQQLSPQSRNSVRSDIESELDDSQLEAVSARAHHMPSITLIRPDQYSGKALPSVRDSDDPAGTELDGLSDFEDEEGNSKQRVHEQQEEDDDDDLRGELDDFMEDDEHDSDSKSMSAAQLQMKSVSGSHQIEDKSKIELHEFDISSEMRERYMRQAEERAVMISVLAGVQPDAYSGLSSLLPTHRLQKLQAMHNVSVSKQHTAAASPDFLPSSALISRPDDLDELDDL